MSYIICVHYDPASFWIQDLSNQDDRLSCATFTHIYWLALILTFWHMLICVLWSFSLEHLYCSSVFTKPFDGDPVNMHVSFWYRHLPDLYRTYRIPFAHTGLVPSQYLHTSTGTILTNIFVGQYCFTIGIVVPAIYRQISSGPVLS